MRFTHPLFLVLLIPVLIGLWYSFRHVHGMARGRKRLAFGIRFLLASLLIFALSGPEARRPNKGLCTMFLLDRSDSVSEADRKRAETFVDEAMKKLSAEDLAGVVAFGKNAVVDAAPGGRRELGKVLSTVDGAASDLAAATRLASASFPDGKARRLVLLSDGNETSGDLEEAAQVAATDGIPLDVVPLGLEERSGEAAVLGVEAPTEIRAEQPFDLRVIVDSARAQRGVLEVDRDGVLLKRLNVSLTAGRNAVVVSEKLKDVGFHRYRATLHAEFDVDNRNNVGLNFVAVRGKPRVLVLQQDPKETTLAEALRKNGLAVDLGGPASIPSKPEELQIYDAVLLNDINAASITLNQMKLLQAAVRDSGVGFAMIGGENSFLPGGYYGSPIAEVLPVDLNIRQRKTFPSTSILIIIDASGSMSMPEDGMSKLQIAGLAAEQTVKLMSPMDRIGVAGSGDGIEFVAPMQKLTNKQAVIDQIRHLSQSGGGIYVRPSVARAKEELEKEQTQVRHFILLADGADAEDHETAIENAGLMRLEHITTSVVAIGDGQDVPFLKQLAAAGGGKFYLALKANQLPAIFTQDTSIMSRSAIEEGAFIPKLVMGEEILRGIADEGVPPLLAYDLTDSRPLARMGMRTKKDDPLLATWQYGLGTSLAFTSDAHPRWAKNWVGWAGFGTFWAQATRAISRRATLNNYQVSVHHDGGKGHVQVKAFDRLGNPLSANNAVVRVATPTGESRDVRLSQEGPGAYVGDFDASEIGTYIVTVAEQDAVGGPRTSATGFSLAYPAEYRSYRTNRPLLERAAALTTGMTLTSPAQALRPVPNPGASITELWPTLMFLAALLLPIDIGVRRLALPLGEILAKVWARLRRRPAAPVTQQVTVGRLQQAKQRAQRETSPEPAPTVIAPGPTKPTAPTPRPTSGTGSTAKGLLDAKRKRGEE
ncbi:VWA domain-containing protein [Fimbriimonas ginsengisoli]|uniref:von Willebrand factor type A n=1 Tax=Fimbriimonas ginsengisoli Gsoil 348 TaxID=661478 RepID=A0A068NQQ5_FIMGI|nr:VWA domain-containing protein [Fimbriimonas ginsengisoli]AIE83934.1 von Willebrand factor type A [Fimbriimonas ginsengisoli Gsoil 348]